MSKITREFVDELIAHSVMESNVVWESTGMLLERILGAEPEEVCLIIEAFYVLYPDWVFAIEKLDPERTKESGYGPSVLFVRYGKDTNLRAVSAQLQRFAFYTEKWSGECVKNREDDVKAKFNKRVLDRAAYEKSLR